ncbi:phenylalanine--tRNA ligase subunit beta [Aliifodinibius sp. S!AR15-10]|uniref:phenylalanine--tRNA ligase subunit beta n=1 Tax=Aliifodinibius sp. S!AR15-10 TaxID=2950437 RepID=UPI00285EDDC4|nr:phenylalanine--tRNA ligase subunit beta [Aliifodinibius sp. S!AR15-10]MDR8392533.1 phenylalanine--tRNA ligase subunit beta [Aliifodinibius sp. S!AR15-10]
MKISYNWLKEFIDFDLSPEETAEKLTLIGLEVDSIEKIGSSLDGVVVGKVLEVSEHPNADRLRLCKVDLGKERVQIVCGADNVAKDQNVPVATVGTTLPLKLENGEPFVIREAKLRGEESRGMICSESELGISDDHSGIMVLQNGVEVGSPISSVLDLYEDTVIDIEISPNRPDATCHLGVARDLAAALDLELKKPFEEDFDDPKPIEKEIDIQIENEEKCHRYVGKMVKGVTIAESPAWIKNRLKAVGVRPVNNVVDITNYVLLELGQPLHAFDYQTIRGKKIVVKDFEKEIEFETLDHIKRTCPAGTLFICDGEGPVAIAGVMGGVDSEVDEETTEILVESAYFDPGTIRKTAKEQNLQTDASYRFERGIDPQLQRIAAERCAELIAKVAGGTIVEGCTDVHPVRTESMELDLRLGYVNRLLGTELDLGEVKDILQGLELELVSEDEETLTYKIPTFRPDLEREVDLIEEVGRLYDYNNIEAPKHAKFISPEPISDHEKLMVRIRDAVKSLRFKEIYTNSLMPEEDATYLGELDQMINTLNPISKEMTTLRPSLLYGFLKAVAYNFNRKNSEVRFFEVGNTFQKAEEGTYFEGIQEETSLLIGLAGLKNIEYWNAEPQPYDLFDLKSNVNALLKQLGILRHVNQRVDKERLIYAVNEVEIGSLYEVKQEMLEHLEIEQPTFAAEFSVTKIEQLLEQLSQEGYDPVSKYPPFEFDLAVVVNANIAAGDLMQTIEDTAGEKLRSIDIFDVFEGESIGEAKKSVAFRLSFLDKNKTLTINDVEPIIEEVLNVLKEQYSATLRA